MRNWKDNIYFILVEPKESGNIGASARAIKNMGFKNLCLVNPPSVITDEARWLACNALDVLNSAEIFNSLTDAVKDKSIIAGTSRRKGRRRGVFLNVEEGAGRLHDIALKNKVAILFGREDRGLYNEEVEECGFLITIPTSKEQPSLNLAQAVLIVAYELSKAEYKSQESRVRSRELRKEKRILVNHEELISLYKRVAETLRLLEYIPKGNRDLERKIMQNLKHFIGRAGLTDWELKMLHGICSQIKKKIK
ncbi:RNA methyltransferase [Dissulfurispira sp.]|uniref:RNA methyltransferase n=1 Tax=Dissulfurispira sp. TaxID=2817609 RepID=UPI002FD9ABE5